MSQRIHSEPELSVVVAVGDHEDSIGHLIRNVASHLSALGRTFEILVVNAGCKDNSLSIASVLPESRVRRAPRPRVRSGPLPVRGA